MTMIALSKINCLNAIVYHEIASKLKRNYKENENNKKYCGFYIPNDRINYCVYVSFGQ